MKLSFGAKAIVVLAVIAFLLLLVNSAKGESASSNVRATLAPLRIDDNVNHPGYSRDLFPTWLDLDGNGCDAREDVLIAESTTPAQVGEKCKVISGTWISLYDGVQTQDLGALDIDHVVPLANAWRSGAYVWTTDKRAEFANSLDYPDHLIAVTNHANRSKGDSAPNEWRPTNKRSWCRYASAWVTVKLNWGLSVTTAERDALGQMLETC